MIPEKTKEKLRPNWGGAAESMNCYAEVRLYDSAGWEAYVYALNPEDDDEILCIAHGVEVSIEQGSLKELIVIAGASGHDIMVDDEYRPQRASELFKKLTQGDYVQHRD